MPRTNTSLDGYRTISSADNPTGSIRANPRRDVVTPPCIETRHDRLRCIPAVTGSKQRSVRCPANIVHVKPDSDRVDLWRRLSTREANYRKAAPPSDVEPSPIRRHDQSVGRLGSAARHLDPAGLRRPLPELTHRLSEMGRRESTFWKGRHGIELDAIRRHHAVHPSHHRDRTAGIDLENLDRFPRAVPDHIQRVLSAVTGTHAQAMGSEALCRRAGAMAGRCLLRLLRST